jgi:phosphate uptake regulator, PhoU
MRIRFDEQLKQLNKEMINMGTMIEKSIGDASKSINETGCRTCPKGNGR